MENSGQNPVTLPLLTVNEMADQYYQGDEPLPSDEHCHVLRKTDRKNKNAKCRLIFASVVCVIFVVAEVVG